MLIEFTQVFVETSNISNRIAIEDRWVERVYPMKDFEGSEIVLTTGFRFVVKEPFEVVMAKFNDL